MADILNTGGDVAPAAPVGHDAAMIAKVDAANAALAPDAKPVEPAAAELIGGKFKTQEDLLKAYQEAERRLSGTPTPKPDAAALTEDAATVLIEKAGIDMGAMSTFFEQNGELGDQHYAALEKAGIPRVYVDQYIAGAEAEATQARDTILGEVGGTEQFQVMSQWAVANLSKTDLQEYNEAVDSGEVAVVRSAVMSLAYRYQRENGRDPKLVGGAPSGGAAGYASIAQLTEAMKDPRYSTDPAYRKEVEQRLSRSNIF
jgi:hypothetical protein